MAEAGTPIKKPSKPKPRILVLGGCGFIGRNFVEYVLENKLVSYVRVVDKVPPETAYLNAKHRRIFNHQFLEFQSSNLIIPEHCKKAFETDVPFDYVINCAGQTTTGQTDPIYKEGIYKLSINCAKEAAKLNLRYVEISTGNLNSDKIPHKEEDPCDDPWTLVAKYKLQVETELKDIPGLKYTILRPAIVYGPGDKTGLTPRLVIGAVYKYMGEMMKLLWGPELRMNTVHVRDVVRAIWHVLKRRETYGHTYHVADHGNSTQGSISAIISEIFNINHDYWGTAMSALAKTDIGSLVEEINDKHLEPWAAACKADNIYNTPLSPYIDQELLSNKHLCLNSGKLTQTIGFIYLYPTLTKETLKEVVDDYVAMKIFPPSLAS
ncbi:uncharacterized protein [Prorops nasuta]|uniref:uncharacterized protein n=1 Tax=Prorops nasuta TaxID=863751 RepID=UPI0034CDBBF5